MKIDTLTHIVCEFGNSMMNRTEIDDDRSVRRATGSNSAYFIKDDISPFLEKQQGLYNIEYTVALQKSSTMV